MIAIECDQCHLIFDKKPSQVKRAGLHFCSDKCHRLHRRLSSGGSEQACFQCGKKFWRAPSKKAKHGCFCNPDCYLQWVAINITKPVRKRTGPRKGDAATARYHADRYRSRKALVDDIKLSSGCLDCGYKENADAMDFDHDGDKKTNVGWMLNGKLSKLMDEIGKCKIRCGNCHRVKTAKSWPSAGKSTATSNNAHRRRRRRDVVEEFKLVAGCFDCGYTKHAVALEFDHVGGNKKAAVAKLLLYGWRVILKEIDKCDVVCVNCHRIRTATRRKKLATSA